MKYISSSMILAISLFLEATVIELPLVLLSLILLGVMYQEKWIFLAAFLTGVFLDMVLFGDIGIRSIFFLVALGIAFLYERKFHILSLPFIGIFSFLTAFFYGIIFSSSHVFLEAISAGVFAVGVFFVFSVVNTKIYRRKEIFEY